MLIWSSFRSEGEYSENGEAYMKKKDPEWPFIKLPNFNEENQITG